MYGTTTLSLSKVLSGISKTLGIVNQAIPIYKEIKPMVTSARKVFEIAKEFNKTSDVKTIDVVPKKEVTESVTSEKLANGSNPVFFQ